MLEYYYYCSEFRRPCDNSGMHLIAEIGAWEAGLELAAWWLARSDRSIYTGSSFLSGFSDADVGGDWKKPPQVLIFHGTRRTYVSVKATRQRVSRRNSILYWLKYEFVRKELTTPSSSMFLYDPPKSVKVIDA